MNARELSQAELARRVGVAQPTIYSLVHSNKVGSKHLHKIARVLGTTPAYLSGETDDPLSDAPPPPELSLEEVELIEIFRRLQPPYRGAAMTLLGGLAGPTS